MVDRCPMCVYSDDYTLVCWDHEEPADDAELTRAAQASIRYIERMRDEGNDDG